MCLISIIVPIYNTAPYLKRSINSILTQSFQDYELLLVDDGSIDGSGSICDQYAMIDSRIRVFHQDNRGVSSARNLGLNHCNGEWVYFVDSDDELLPGGLQTLVDCISDDVDIVMGGFIEVDENGNTISIAEKGDLSLSKQQSVITLYGGYGSYYPYCGYLWMRLLRRRIIQKCHLHFDTSIAIKEDTLFLAEYVCKSNGLTHQTTTPVYKYQRRSDSAMGKALNGFNLEYVDSFYALVRMKHEVDATFPPCSVPVFVAKHAIYARYHNIIDMMDAASVSDEALKDELLSIMREEIGSVFLFRIRKKLRKLLKSCCKHV